MGSSDDIRSYALGALAVGGTMLAVGGVMWWLGKADEKSQPFFKDDKPTREFKPPFLGALDTIRDLGAEHYAIDFHEMDDGSVMVFFNTRHDFQTFLIAARTDPLLKVVDMYDGTDRNQRTWVRVKHREGGS